MSAMSQSTACTPGHVDRLDVEPGDREAVGGEPLGGRPADAVCRTCDDRGGHCAILTSAGRPRSDPEDPCASPVSSRSFFVFPRSSCVPTGRRTRSSSGSRPTRASRASAEADTAPAVARAAVEMPASHAIAQGLGELVDRPRSARDRADLARPVREERALRPSRRRAARDVGDRHRALRPRGQDPRPAGAPAARRSLPRPRAGVRLGAHALDARRRARAGVVLSRAGLPRGQARLGADRPGRAPGRRARPQRRARRAGPTSS